MTIFSPVMSVLSILIYFFISIIMPFFGYLVPYYKIKKVNVFGRRYRLIVNLGVALILYILNIKILIIYLVYPFLTEFLFYLTQKFTHKIKTFDRITLMTTISTLAMIFLVYYNRVAIEKVIEETFRTSNITSYISIKNPQDFIMYFKENILVLFFSNLFVGNILLFLTLAGNTYEKWKISCYWLLPFMAIMLANKVFGQSFNPYIESNIIYIIRYIFVWFGIKVLYQLSGIIGIKFNILKHIFSILLGMFFPLPVFIIGALASFDIVEVETIKI